MAAFNYPTELIAHIEVTDIEVEFRHPWVWPVNYGIYKMNSNDFLRRKVIQKNVLQHAEKSRDDAIILWEQLAKKIISIVGKGGFNSLYARSAFLSQATFPWLAVGASSPQNEYRFAELITSFEGQTPAQASAANDLLLITFTDLLAALIGEQLTVDILRSAWGNDDTETVTNSDSVGKELNDE